MKARTEERLREASEERWAELGGALGEAQASIELLHERGCLSDELFWEALGALGGMFTLADDVLAELRGKP